MSLSARRSMPGIQPTVEIAVRRWVIPRSGSRSQAASTLSRFIIGSPMPMNTQWSDAARCAGSAAPGRGSPRRSGCGRSSSCRWRRTCTSAGSRTARTRRSSAGRRGSASARPRPGARRPCANSALTVPSRACASRSSSSVENGTSRGELLAQRGRQVGHLARSPRAARGPRPHLARAEGGLAAGGERLVEEREVHEKVRSGRLAGRAAREVPRPRGRRLAARGRAARSPTGA